ncbi:MAG: coiled-coil domain-containing protein [Planctomycetota bacterium]
MEHALRAAAMVLLCASAPGCVGYVMGWRDAEVESLRRIVSELEAKNAELVEKYLSLRGRLEKMERESGPGSASARATEAAAIGTDAAGPLPPGSAGGR